MLSGNGPTRIEDYQILGALFPLYSLINFPLIVLYRIFYSTDTRELDTPAI